MGVYVNPENCEKEVFLREKAVEVTMDIVEIFDFKAHKDTLPVVLVDNGCFTAAGIAFCDRERDLFLLPDGRPKKYYLAKVEDLLEVSEGLESFVG